MKFKISYIAIISLLAAMLFSSCDNYLDVLPKGEKIPTSLADYEAFIRNEYNHLNDAAQAINLLNDVYKRPSDLSYVSLSSINYNWMGNEDRIIQNNSDEQAYYYSYAAISYWNLIINNVPDATEASDAEKLGLIAQAKVLRAMNYFHLTNYYAEQYDEATAATKLSVPLITSADMGAPSEQISIAKMYEFILTDLTDAIPNLPIESATLLHPDLGCGYAMLARVYLQMEDYDSALKYAQNALDQNNKLFNWKEYYTENKEQIEKEDDWSTSYPSKTMTSPENYIFRYGSSTYKNSGQSGTNAALTLVRAAQFEDGDARFASKWKKKYQAPDSIYYGIRSDKFNAGGITTPEMYYIKAECLARKGGQANLDEAMLSLNTVRKTRIFDDKYADLTASSTAEAIAYIRKEKANEYVQTAIPFWDMKRFNKDANYAQTLTKVFDNQSLELSPDSHMWVMPFPMGATSNPGNGTLVQNTPR
ncbi:RagB/SusD family nutrient uptake outer membrane protein [Labilibaculum euxinus]|uniref:Starch-binding protein n=1 Tax=Labilibaculum euxinus TaxID=2686357 RepID=A0A7M4D9C3_9BACT|nr:RagB/SusD family nutrient uptake outer membrane protein [Labilibaculum euxinus]MUP39252.1 starch-binding protein [Labilibaculum euxinus]MVB08457.1 starch-binding protein [Labilibaculum euxinus]